MINRILFRHLGIENEIALIIINSIPSFIGLFLSQILLLIYFSNNISFKTYFYISIPILTIFLADEFKPIFSENTVTDVFDLIFILIAWFFAMLFHKAITVKKISLLTFFLLVILIPSLSLYAHSGRTDQSGGHYNRKTGEYHYHNSGHSSNKNNNEEEYLEIGLLALYLIAIYCKKK